MPPKKEKGEQNYLRLTKILNTINYRLLIWEIQCLSQNNLINATLIFKKTVFLHWRNFLPAPGVLLWRYMTH